MTEIKKDGMTTSYYRILERLNKEFDGIRVDLDATLATVNDGLRTDPMTGLSSKFNFDSQLLTSMNIIVFGDISRFKYYNDKYGHEVGDDIIRALAKHMLSLFAGISSAHSFHLSGDEFALLFSESDWAEARVRVDSLDSVELDLSAVNEDRDRYISISLGHTHCKDGESPSAALKRAEAACQYGKAENEVNPTYRESMTNLDWISLRDTCTNCGFKVTLFGLAPKLQEQRPMVTISKGTTLCELQVSCPVCGQRF